MKCPYFGKCGGCLYNLSYKEQLNQKINYIKQLFNFKEIKIFEGKQFHYRNRMDFCFCQKGLGLKKRGSWSEIVCINECLIADKRINEILKEITKFFKNINVFDFKKKQGDFMHAVIRTALTDSVSFVLNKDSNLTDAKLKIKEFAKKTDVKNILIAYLPKNSSVSVSENFEVVKGEEFLEEKIMEKKFLFHSQGFFQVNKEMAEKMNLYIRKLLFPSYRLIDLYSGVGVFGIINSDLFKHVILIESNKLSVKLAKKNIELNKVKNIKVIESDAKHLLKFIKEGQNTILILDPPRSGLTRKLIKSLNKLKFKKIIYVSCNPKNLKRDLEHLNYKLKSLAVFDFFPNTQHIECVAELEEQI